MVMVGGKSANTAFNCEVHVRILLSLNSDILHIPGFDSDHLFEDLNLLLILSETAAN